MTRPGAVALVTGATRNIGAAVAERLAQAGHRVAVNYRATDSEAEANAVVERITAAGGIAGAYQASVGDKGEVDRMVAAVTRDLGPPTVLVNNAATSVASRVNWLEITPEEWARVQQVNLGGAFLCARAVYAGMCEAGGGSIVSMSSIRVPLGMGGNIHYTSSKAALIGFTRTLARDIGVDNIRVNALVVGAILTSDEAEYGQQEEIDARVIAQQAIPRRGTCEEIGDAVVFLASPAASFITGQSIVVDGGWAMS